MSAQLPQILAATAFAAILTRIALACRPRPKAIKIRARRR